MITTKKLSRTFKLLFPLGALIVSACSSHHDDKDTPALSFQSAQSTFELENYYSTGTYPLAVGSGDNLLSAEASGITYNPTTGTLFVIGDGATSVVQVSKTGTPIDSMELAPNAFADTEGIAWVNGNQFVLVEERLRQVDQFTYIGNSTLDASAAKIVKLGTTVGNIGLEGISYDPMTAGYILAKQMDPMGVFQTTINFTALTASNGSPTTVDSINLFDPAKLGFQSTSINDVFAVSNILPSSAPDYDNILGIDATDGKIVKVDRAGNIQSTLAMSASAQNEGATMDTNGNLYTVGEKAAGDGHPGMTVFTPTKSKTAVGVGSNLYLTFAQAVTAGSGNIVLSNGAGDVRTIPVGDAQVTISGKVVKINPTFDLAPGTTYSITYAEGVFTGVKAVSSTSALTFKTVGEVDTTAPTLASSSPIDDAANIPVDSAITLTFNETVRSGTGNIMIVSASSDTRTIDVTDTSQVSFNGSTVTITPSTPLQNSTAYNVQMTNGVIKDSSGNAFAGILSSATLNFTTVSLVVAAPTVLISEVNSNAKTAKVDFFEIYNYGSAAADISGWKWGDNHASAKDPNNTETFPSNTVIPAGGRLVINSATTDGDATSFMTVWGLNASTTQVLVMGTAKIGLGAGDAVILYGSDGKVAAAMNYGAAVLVTQGDSSTVTVPTATASTGVTFVAGSHAGTAFGGTDSSSAVWDGVSTSAPAYKAAVVGDGLGSYAAPGDANDIGSPGKPITTPAAAPKVLISEVNSNAKTAKVDFFEIYNYGTAAADISGWKWGDNHASAMDASNTEVFPSNTVIPAGGRLVVNNAGSSADATSFMTVWGLNSSTTQVLVMGTAKIGLGAGDAVILYGSDGKVAASMNYGAALSVTQGDSSTVTVPTATASTGVTFVANSHAGTAFGGTDSISAVWDGVSTSAPAYKAAVAGDSLHSYAAPGEASDIGSPGQ